MFIKRLLKIIISLIGSLLLLTVLFLSGFAIYYYRIVNIDPQQMPVPVRAGELGQWVNPFIGTGGYPWVCAHNFPGATLPFGMVRLSPETASILFNKKALNTSGYYYGDNKIIGFSHTRLSGTGATDGGHFLVLPVNDHDSQKQFNDDLYARFSHQDEVAFPGYYAVKFGSSGILAELTSTERVGVHRYTSPENKTPHILINVSHALGHGKSKDGTVQIYPETQEIHGSIHTFGSFSGRYGGIRVYFAAHFNQPFTSFGVWNGDSFLPNQTTTAGKDIGIDVSFTPGQPQQVVVLKLAISYVSIENARENLQAETGSNSFDDIVTQARQTWEEKLSLIRLTGGTEEQKVNFYTALYRSFLMPTVFNDVNGDYIGFDKHIHKTSGFRYYTDFSLWDTFRTVHPLFTLIAPKEQRDMLVSLVQMVKQGGWLPRWPSGYGYTNSMLGTPADIMIAGSYLKGIHDFDIETAYAAMRQTALHPTPPKASYSGREGIEFYLKYKYCPSDFMKEAVARTLEFAYADRALSALAEKRGYAEDAEIFLNHSRYYQNLWNPFTKYFQPKDSHGVFTEKFRPKLLTYLDKNGEYTNDYVEGSALQWRWGVPFDVPGLISLFSSSDSFVNELNDFFTKANPKRAAWNPGPYYWHGNQPDIHAAYLFNDASRPDLTQKWVRWILDNKYNNSFNGLDGNDDGGTLSAWYVFSALGFYPVAGFDKYQIGAPLFHKAEIKVAGNSLKIIADNYSPENIYVQNVQLNDSLLNRTWLKHAELVQGGILRFKMGPKPVRK